MKNDMLLEGRLINLKEKLVTASQSRPNGLNRKIVPANGIQATIPIGDFDFSRQTGLASKRVSNIDTLIEQETLAMRVMQYSVAVSKIVEMSAQFFIEHSMNNVSESDSVPLLTCSNKSSTGHEVCLSIILIRSCSFKFLILNIRLYYLHLSRQNLSTLRY